MTVVANKPAVGDLRQSAGVASPFAPTTARLAPHQWGWLVIQAIGGAVISGAIDFGIHVAVFSNTSAVHLFSLPNSIAGDLVVTLFVQCCITWIVGGLLGWSNLWQRAVAPLAPPARPAWLQRAAARDVVLVHYSAVKSATGFLCLRFRAPALWEEPPAPPLLPADALPVSVASAVAAAPVAPPSTRRGRHRCRACAAQLGTGCGRVCAWWLATPDPVHAAACHALHADAARAALVMPPRDDSGGSGGGGSSKQLLPPPPPPLSRRTSSNADPLVAAVAAVVPAPALLTGSRGCGACCCATAGLCGRGALFAAVAFPLFWGVTIGICAGVWGATDYNRYPQAPLIAAVFGFALGAVAVPVLSVTILWRASRYVVVQPDLQTSAAAQGDGRGGGQRLSSVESVEMAATQGGTLPLPEGTAGGGGGSGGNGEMDAGAWQAQPVPPPTVAPSPQAAAARRRQTPSARRNTPAAATTTTTKSLADGAAD